MSLLDDIRNAQVRAGEGAVIARLQKLGLVDKPKAEKDPRDIKIEQLQAALLRFVENSTAQVNLPDECEQAEAALRGEGVK